MDRERKQRAFTQLHLGPSLFLMPNAWDVLSAQMFEWAGHTALGTTSAGIAASHGYPDGEKIPFELFLKEVEKIAGSVQIPVSVDMESGFAFSIGQLLDNVQSVIEAGAVGINIEDTADHENKSLSDPHRQAEKIRAIKEHTTSNRASLFVNARIDTYWNSNLPTQQLLEETIQRCRCYTEAGADCLFVPGLRRLEDIRTLRREVSLPINLLLVPATPPIHELEKIGINRLSVGSGPVRAVAGLLKELAVSLHEKDIGRYLSLSRHQMPYPELNNWLDSKKRPPE